MTYPAPTPPTGRDVELRRAIVDDLRQHGAGSARLVQAFALGRGLNHSDLQALVAIIAGDDAGEPLTPARLREHIGLSSAGATYVVDRLEQAGYVRRTQDHPTNRRLVQLRYTRTGLSTVSDFFGPLSASIDEVMSEFDEVELTIVEQFLAGVISAMRAQIRTIAAPIDGRRPGEPAGAHA